MIGKKNPVETKIYKNKYRKLFIDSVTVGASAQSASDNLLNVPYEFQDPSYVGFTIRFDFNGLTNLYDFDNLPNSLLMDESSEYSAVAYLENINEPTRAGYLRHFIAGLESLQKDTPWYFQSISGLDTLQTIDTKKGWRLSEDTVITIETLESIDMRVSALIDLYRKAAWDETYNRWMLPENMRWFKVEIVIAEFREFHIAKPTIDSLPNGNNEVPGLGENANGGIASQVASMSSAVGKVSSAITRGGDIIDRASNLLNPDGSLNISATMVTPTNEFLPMHVLTLDMCEFDFLNKSHPYMSSINMADGTEEITQSIAFKVGRVVEDHVYTLHNIYLREDSIRQLAASTQLITGDMQKVMMGKEDALPDTVTHNGSNTNFLLDRAKSVVGDIVTNALDSFVSQLLLSSAYDGDKIDAQFEREMQKARRSLQNHVESYIETNGVRRDLGEVDLTPPSSVGVSKRNLGDAISNEKFVYKEPADENTLTYTNSPIEITPKNIGFELPDIDIDMPDNIGLED